MSGDNHCVGFFKQPKVSTIIIIIIAVTIVTTVQSPSYHLPRYYLQARGDANRVYHFCRDNVVVALFNVVVVQVHALDKERGTGHPRSLLIFLGRLIVFQQVIRYMVW